MYGCESRTIQKAERWRIGALNSAGENSWRVPWKARRSSQSILKEISPEYSWMDWCWRFNTLATWGKELTRWKRAGWWERRGQQRMKWLDSVTNSMDRNSSKLWETVKDRETWYPAVHGLKKNQTQLRDCTTTTYQDCEWLRVGKAGIYYVLFENIPWSHHYMLGFSVCHII